MTDTVSQEKRSQIMSRIRSSGTKLETEVGTAIWRRGFRYRKNAKEMPGKPDFVFPGARTVLFIDSCFWHGCPDHLRMPKSNIDYWRKKIQKNIERDMAVTREYKQMGWQVIRVWEHSLKKTFDENVDRICNLLRKGYDASNE